MKKVKKILSLLLVAVMVASAPLSSKASSPKSINEKKEYLTSLGITQDYLNEISEEKIDELYNRYSVITRSNNDTVYQWSGYDVQIKEFEEQPTTRGSISPSKLKLVIGYMNELQGSKITGVVVETYYEWLSGPSVRIGDAIAVSWESSVFNSDGFYAESNGYVDGKFVQCDYVTTATTENNQGVGWNFSLTSPSHPGVLVNNLHGGGAVHLYPVNPLTTGSGTSCQFYVTYGHKTIAIGVGIKFTASGGYLTILPSTTVDTLTSDYRWRSNVSSGSGN